jgi:beta-lactamase regulating signal transducer with metallopeptidase domain
MIGLAALPGALWPFLLDSALKATLLLGLAALGTIALRKTSAAIRHLVWLFAFAAILVMPLLSLLPGWRILPQWSRVAELCNLPTTTVAPAIVSSQSPPDAIVDTFDRSATEALPHESASMATADWLVIAWMAGVFLFLVRLCAAQWVLRHETRNCRRIMDGPLAIAMGEAARQVRLRRSVELLIARGKTIPMAWGVFRPRLVLPAEAVEWTPQPLASVLIHELAHVKRRDIAVQWLTQLACAWHWFNPLVWFAVRRLRLERERACDDLVLSAGVRPSEYAEHLLNVATTLAQDSWAHGSAVAMARPGGLGRPAFGRAQRTAQSPTSHPRTGRGGSRTWPLRDDPRGHRARGGQPENAG